MARPSLLVLTTYPIAKPRHGGQIRTDALVNSYRDAGFSVSHLAVYEKGAYAPEALGAHDIAFPINDEQWFFGGRNVPFSTDLCSGLFASQSEEAYRQICKTIPRKIDVFHLEQPWLLPVVKRLKKERSEYAGAVVVYGSQNIEAPLRNAIYQQMSVPGGEEVVEAIEDLEKEACRFSDLTLAVAPHDQQMLAQWGAKQVMRAPNGIAPWSAKAELVEAWRRKLNARSVALFVGSAHPPNFDGFFRAFGDSLGFVPPDSRIVVAGGVGAHIAAWYQKSRFSPLNFSRLEIVGEVDNENLAALKTLATHFLLPIFEGGGSNIKTAEAIYSGKRVIATSTSLRGYEPYLTLPEITVADTMAEFRHAVRTALAPAAKPQGAINGTALRSNLLWKNCLAVVPPAVRELLSSRTAHA